MGEAPRAHAPRDARDRRTIRTTSLDTIGRQPILRGPWQVERGRPRRLTRSRPQFCQAIRRRAPGTGVRAAPELAENGRWNPGCSPTDTTRLRGYAPPQGRSTPPHPGSAPARARREADPPLQYARLGSRPREQGEGGTSPLVGSRVHPEQESPVPSTPGSLHPSALRQCGRGNEAATRLARRTCPPKHRRRQPAARRQPHISRRGRPGRAGSAGDDARSFRWVSRRDPSADPRTARLGDGRQGRCRNPPEGRADRSGSPTGPRSDPQGAREQSGHRPEW